MRKLTLAVITLAVAAGAAPLDAGRSVYGGSDLTCVRGGWDALNRMPIAANVHLAVNQARRYDECIP